MTEVSVVVPVYGNAATLPQLHRRLVEALADEGETQIVLVDDASPDESASVASRLAREDPRVELLKLDRNVGQHAAALRGLAGADGSWSVVMDADLQDPPEAIPRLLAEARRGPEVVFAGRRGRYESVLRLWTSRVFKHTLAFLTGVPRDAGMFFVVSRRGTRRLLSLDGPPPFVVAMLGRAGLEMSSVPVRREPALSSSYSAGMRLRNALRGLRWALAKPRWRDGDEPDQLAALELHNEAQRRYYSGASKRGMRPRPSRYLERHVDELIRFGDIPPGSRLLEVGCGMGRYTLPLVDRGYEVSGIDLSGELLARLRSQAGGRRIALHEGDVIDPPAALGSGFDAVVGFFALHHLHDVPGCFRAMLSLLRPGGLVAFVEPNPYNPLYYVQLAITPEMTWEGDRGMVGMRRRPLIEALRSAGFQDPRFERFGFFPPFLAERRRAGSLELALERLPVLGPILPFQLVGGRRGSDPASAP